MSLVVQMQDAGLAAQDPLLSYTVTTTPSPLKASPENPQAPEETGEIVISVSRQSGTPADLQSIRLQVPAGTMSVDLATDLAKITPRITLTGWTARLESAAKEFVFTPTASHTPIGPDTGFTIQLSDIPVSRKVGTAPITLTESSRIGNADFQDRTTAFNIGKFPADFYLRNFLCEPSIIDNGGDVKLTWERSANATYDLLYPGVERDVTNRTSLEIEGIKSDTTFYLRATTGDPTNPVTRILSAQVSVLKPDLDIGNLTVNGTITANGTVTANGPVQANDTVTIAADKTLDVAEIHVSEIYAKSGEKVTFNDKVHFGHTSGEVTLDHRGFPEQVITAGHTIELRTALDDGTARSLNGASGNSWGDRNATWVQTNGGPSGGIIIHHPPLPPSTEQPPNSE
ncbi:hypothetical protein [Streptomyces subrutilus]|uniref:Uncharacterized protein n=1 Tax=Streptomyces subrutilus TaxID=36818 RepID=A0A1E5PKQ6_9ACTN|nr:hypothetical protein [Streptomyces subrutilus]OEJ30033.1 hypothetical protein BGK67_00300 [Streptomyces subrutilus]